MEAGAINRSARAEMATALCVSALLIALASSGRAWYQDPFPSRPLTGLGMIGTGIEPALQVKRVLLRRPQIAEELKILPSQRAQMDKLEEQFSKWMNEETERNRRELSPEAFKEYRRNRYSMSVPAEAELESKILKILTQTQRSRLDQIQIQAEGPMAFRRAEIQQRLNLSPNQTEAIEALIEQAKQAAKNASLVHVPPPPTEKERSVPTKVSQDTVAQARERMVEVRKSTMQSISKILTRRQRMIYEKLVGEPFDFLKMQAEREKAAEQAAKKQTGEGRGPESPPASR